MGKRGMHHATAFQANASFEVVGICDIDPARLDEAARQARATPGPGTDAAAMARELKPDVFCFCTLPNVRSAMIQIGIEMRRQAHRLREAGGAHVSAEGLEIKRAARREPASRPWSATSTATASTTRR